MSIFGRWGCVASWRTMKRAAAPPCECSSMQALTTAPSPFPTGARRAACGQDARGPPPTRREHRRRRHPLRARGEHGSLGRGGVRRRQRRRADCGWGAPEAAGSQFGWPSNLIWTCPSHASAHHGASPLIAPRRKRIWMSPASSTAFFRLCSEPSPRARVRSLQPPLDPAHVNVLTTAPHPSPQPPLRATLFTDAQQLRPLYDFARSGSSAAPSAPRTASRAPSRCDGPLKAADCL